MSTRCNVFLRESFIHERRLIGDDASATVFSIAYRIDVPVTFPPSFEWTQSGAFSFYLSKQKNRREQLARQS